MLNFDDIKPGARLRGLRPTGIAEVVQVSRFGADALNLVFRADGQVGERLLYRGEESALELEQSGRVYKRLNNKAACRNSPYLAKSIEGKSMQRQHL